jgi:dipeptide/tripeptide permease
MIIASVVMILGFVLLGNTTSFYPFLFSTMFLGLGMGVFKPALQGIVASYNNDNSGNSSNNNSSLG